MQTGICERPNGTLAYTDYGGSGELVLMFPGMGALRSEYRFLGPQLVEAGFHPVAVDLRGHGDSSVPWPVYDVPSTGEDVLAMIDHLDAGPAHVIGTSFAAAPAVWAGVEQPDRVRSLVLISAFVRADTKVNPLMSVGYWVMMHNPWRVRLWAMYYRTLYPTHKPPDFQAYLRALRKNMAEEGRFHAADALSTSSRVPSAERLSRVTAPTLVMMGAKDGDFGDPAEEGRLIAEATHGRLEVVPGAGHYPQTEFPEVAGPVIVAFLGGGRDS